MMGIVFLLCWALKAPWWVFLISLLLSSGGFRVVIRKDEEDNQGPKNPYSGDRV